MCQQARFFDVSDGASLSVEEESRYENVQVEHLQALVDLEGEESLLVVLTLVPESLAGVEGSHSEIPPSSGCDLQEMVMRSLPSKVPPTNVKEADVWHP
ncbi:hypothetical protein M5K25_003833 [Dendrobium thyrsiflorum]|uniref:Uncharacterized protein n=1 Tax=Dendrobium thyrsiflorum TaxID=117978 RepID=A0ABD0VKB1_DENTH